MGGLNREGSELRVWIERGLNWGGSESVGVWIRGLNRVGSELGGSESVNREVSELGVWIGGVWIGRGLNWPVITFYLPTSQSFNYCKIHNFDRNEGKILMVRIYFCCALWSFYFHPQRKCRLEEEAPTWVVPPSLSVAGGA